MLDEKPWYESKTIWGSLVAVAAALSATLGLPIEQTVQSEVAGVLVQLVGAIGSLTAIYGRLSATRAIS